MDSQTAFSQSQRSQQNPDHQQQKEDRHPKSHQALVFPEKFAQQSFERLIQGAVPGASPLPTSLHVISILDSHVSSLVNTWPAEIDARLPQLRFFALAHEIR